jgi:hypothetical protein
LRRSYELLEQTQGISADLEERRQRHREFEAAERRTDPSEPLPPLGRPLSAGRDWHFGRIWIQQIADQRVDKLRTQMVESIGRVVAMERAVFRKQIEEAKAAMREQAAQAVAEIVTERLEAQFAKLDQLLTRLCDTRLAAVDAAHDLVRH